MVTYGFYNSINHDRRYNAEQMSAIFDGIIRDGVFMSVGGAFAIAPASGMTVTVDAGRAWFNSTWTHNDSKLPLTLSPAEVYLSRIDAVVIEIDSETRVNAIKVIKGTPASTPTKPAMTNTTTKHQHPLGYITMSAGATSISDGNIAGVVGTSECPFVSGILETANVDALYGAWQGQFEEWFENLQTNLEGDVAANLQMQIDQRLKTSDKASTSEAEAGLDDMKWMTPLRVVESVRKNSGLVNNQLGEKGIIWSGEAIPMLAQSPVLSLSQGNSTYGPYACCETKDYIVTVASRYASTQPSSIFQVFRFDKRTAKSRSFTLSTENWHGYLAVQPYKDTNTVLIVYLGSSNGTQYARRLNIDGTPAWLGSSAAVATTYEEVRLLDNGMVYLGWSVDGSTFTFRFLDSNMAPITKVHAVVNMQRVGPVDSYGSWLAIGVSSTSNNGPKVLLLETTSMTVSEIISFPTLGGSNQYALVLFNADGSKLTCLGMSREMSNYNSCVYDMATGPGAIVSRNASVPFKDVGEAGLRRDRQSGFIITPYNGSYLHVIRLDGSPGPYASVGNWQYLSGPGGGKIADMSTQVLYELSTLTTTDIQLPTGLPAVDPGNRCKVFDSGWMVLTKKYSSGDSYTHYILRTDYTSIMGFRKGG